MTPCGGPTRSAVTTPGIAELAVETFEIAEILSFPTAMNVNSTLEVITVLDTVSHGPR